MLTLLPPQLPFERQDIYWKYLPCRPERHSFLSRYTWYPILRIIYSPNGQLFICREAQRRSI